MQLTVYSHQISCANTVWMSKSTVLRHQKFWWSTAAEWTLCNITYSQVSHNSTTSGYCVASSMYLTFFLQIKNSHISIIHTLAFAHLSNVRYLYMHRVSIGTLQEKAFGELSHPQHIFFITFLSSHRFTFQVVCIGCRTYSYAARSRFSFLKHFYNKLFTPLCNSI